MTEEELKKLGRDHLNLTDNKAARRRAARARAKRRRYARQKEAQARVLNGIYHWTEVGLRTFCNLCVTRKWLDRQRWRFTIKTAQACDQCQRVPVQAAAEPPLPLPLQDRLRDWSEVPVDQLVGRAVMTNRARGLEVHSAR